jgi:nucleoside-diphosphate-sugar epimerase
MEIAITGGTGFLGSHVLNLATRNGYAVRALYHTNPPRKKITNHRIKWIRGNINSKNSWDKLLKGVDAVIHLAASGVSNINESLDAISTNLPAHLHLINAAARHGVKRIVVAGSCFEYGRFGERIGNRGLTELDPLEPVNIYAASKAAATLLTGPLARDLGLECFIMRPFHIYGPGETPLRMIPTVIRSALLGDNICTTDGRQIRDLVHVCDVADGFVRGIQVEWPQLEPGCRILNLSSGNGLTLRSVIELLVKSCNRNLESIQFGAIGHRQNEMWRLVGDPSAASDVLGWRSTVDLDYGFRQMISEQIKDIK